MAQVAFVGGLAGPAHDDTWSLATMSMVGYLLGLGDRHPSNLMLDRYSGKLLRIDFGDCFEASMHREKFPDAAVPFGRWCAMEVTASRATSEHVRGRDGGARGNKDSVMAMLEAFVHDPLINWRLLNTTPSKTPTSTQRGRHDDVAVHTSSNAPTPAAPGPGTGLEQASQPGLRGALAACHAADVAVRGRGPRGRGDGARDGGEYDAAAGDRPGDGGPGRRRVG